MKNKWLTASILILGAATVINAYAYSVLNKENKMLEEENRSYSAKIEELNIQLQSERQKQEAVTDTAGLSDIMAMEWKRQGFEGTSEEIKADLLEHPELIPYEGVLGGQMGFSEIELLTDQWAFAGFEDGHINGYMLLRYEFQGNDISWRVIDSYLPGE